ncbi:MAG: FHA domain-containing protein [Chloroflexi bacterium]|nr:MAG: FHA domain-containing protein [Chloroflexota bacterium]
MFIIDYTTPDGQRRRFESRANTILIGRTTPHQTVDLDLTPDSTVSRMHARLTFDNGAYYLEDLGSKYGTLVNGRPILSKIRLTPGAKITMGRTVLEIFIPEVGMLTHSVSASESTPNLLLAQYRDAASLEAIRRRLTAFYELSMALGTVHDVGQMIDSVVDYLCKFIPEAQRSALLLLEDEELVLKAYHPERMKPSVSQSLAALALDTQEAFMWRRGAPGKTGLLSDSVIRHGTQAAMYAPLIWQGEVLGVLFADNFMSRSVFNEDDLRLLMAMANQVSMFIKNHQLQQSLRHQEVIRSNLLRQFSPQVAGRLEQWLKETNHLRLGGKRANPVTILTSDVRGFTTLSAQMEPPDIVKMLNELFGVCIPIIFKYNGTIDKYVGDAILAVFGSPDPDEHQWQKAVQTAIEMQEAIADLNRQREAQGLPVCEVGIGIHTGEVLHGFIGSEEHMEFTVIGDTVNRTARYCDGAGPGEIIISPAVFEHVDELVEATPRLIKSKHPDTEPDLEAYVVHRLRPSDPNDTMPVKADTGPL